MGNREELNLDALDNVNGGSIGFNPDSNGTYTMKCQFTGNVYYNIPLSQVIEVGKFAATVPNTLEGEQQIINWAHGAGII